MDAEKIATARKDAELLQKIWDDHSQPWELAQVVLEALDALETAEGENERLWRAVSELSGGEIKRETVQVKGRLRAAVETELARLEEPVFEDGPSRPAWWEWKRRAWCDGVRCAREVAAINLRAALVSRSERNER